MVVADAGVGGCGLGEPNDTRDQPTPILLGTSYTNVCLSGPDDVDTFQFTTPAGAAGGYAKVVLSNVRDVATRMQVTAQSSNHKIMSAQEAVGESVTGYFTVAPGEKFNVAVSSNYGSDVGIYDVEIEFIAFVDAFESNQTRDEAKRITAGTAVRAQLVALNGPNATKDEDFDDWYEVELPAGKATIEIAEVPTNVAIRYELLNAGGTRVDDDTVSLGESLTRTEVEIGAAGLYFVHIYTYINHESYSENDTIPDNFTRQYTLKVSAN